MDEVLLTADQVLAGAMYQDMFPGGWVWYSSRCAAWTHDGDDLAVSPEGIPLCPCCGAPGLQTDLGDFIQAALDNPDHYGPGGVETFMAAHLQNCQGVCHRTWVDYG